MYAETIATGAIAAGNSAEMTTTDSVTPALVAGIHAFRRVALQGVDGRDKPGHDNGKNVSA
jgi:hypothetical protein